MKNIIPGRRSIFGYGFKDVVGPQKRSDHIFNKLAFKVSPKNVSEKKMIFPLHPFF